MSQILPLSLQALQNDAAAMDRIGTNIANLATPGYRREGAIAHAVLPTGVSPFSQLVDNGAATEPSSAAGPASALSQAGERIHFDARHGSLRTTGQSLDLALLGPGFFEVATDHGPAFTRNGQFQLDPRGRLVTASGHAVMGRGGEILLSPGPVDIDEAGQLSQNGRVVAQLKVVDLDGAGGQLSHPEGSLYTSDAVPRPVAEADVLVRQGALEGSNVDHMTEVVGMMQTMRHFETMTRVVQGYDEMMGTAIRKLGEF